MPGRRLPLPAAIAACAMLCGALACATPTGAGAHGGRAEVGAPCDGTWTAATDGVTVVPFSGTVFGVTADGSRNPLAGARFVVLAGAPGGRLPIRTDAQGRFHGKVLLPTHNARECRDGVVKAGFVIGSATISVRAKGCADAEVTVDARWEPRPIDLRCEK